MKILNKLALISVIFFVGCISTKLPQNTKEYAKTSAMITLPSMHSGGSGVILRSYPNQSFILTNCHICNLIQNGGVVTTDEGSYPVHSFRVYKRHDLCLISVLADLHENTKLASMPPEVYGRVVAAGHPALLPTIITRGHFANHMSIDVTVGTEKCDGSEEGQMAFFCMFTGSKPLVKTFESQPITATIMPGSSGSGVFNSKGEIAGLVFAGAGDLGYGFIVPYEYVRDFLTHLNQYALQYPDPNKKPVNYFQTMFKMQDICLDHIQDCKGITFPGLYHD